jgi:hypothetical protein
VQVILGAATIGNVIRRLFPVSWLAGVLGVCSAAWLQPATAFGPNGHRIAGRLAEPLLCAAARADIEVLGGGDGLGEIGQWADQIRSSPTWRHTAPWHYLNVDEANEVRGSVAAAAVLRGYRSPREGDVLFAIERFTAELGERARSRAQRALALRFLVHFVVDVHQPLHVGRATDRGGNAIDVRYGTTSVNLHRFWDTDVIGLVGLSPRRYASALTERLDPAVARRRSGTPRDWAAEGLALRSRVYGYAPDGVLDDVYLAAAQGIAEERLVRAAERLAATLNGIYCRG